MLNKGLGFSDEFEIEVCRYSEKSSSKLKQQYKDWTSSMRKEGTAFLKSVRDKVHFDASVLSAVRNIILFPGKSRNEVCCENGKQASKLRAHLIVALILIWYILVSGSFRGNWATKM